MYFTLLSLFGVDSCSIKQVMPQKLTGIDALSLHTGPFEWVPCTLAISVWKGETNIFLKVAR